MEVVEAAEEVIADRYRLGPVLGRGGMGEVREATDQRLGRSVAVKLLQPSMASDPGARNRFEDEARSAAKLVHPNTVAVFDTGEHEGIPYIVMEHLPGRTLADEIAEGPLAPARVRTVALQVLGALEAAHRAGVIHRDIKPGNILLTTDGTAKVGDFGIAKTAEGLDHTATGMILGTPSYLAPERILGAPATERSDLYATGVVLYEALTGSKPFAARTPLATAAAIQHGEPPPLTDARTGADPGLIAAIERAMAKDPERRFASAAAMAADIQAAQAPTAEATRNIATPVTTTMPTTSPPGAVSPPMHAQEPAGPSRAPMRVPPLAIAAPVLAALLMVAILFAGRGDDEPAGDGDPATTAPTAGTPALPGDLERRVRELEEAVEP